MLLSCLKPSLCITFFYIFQCVLYPLPLCWNRDFRGLSVGALERFLCQTPLSAQKLHIPASAAPLVVQLPALRKTWAREALSIDFSLLCGAVSFPGIALMPRCWLSGSCRGAEPKAAQPKVQVNFSVSQDNNSYKANIAPYKEWFEVALHILTVF